ncbi:hypothetical protein BH11MYX1_BH11MYX1_29710 [soil metagenome]
MGTFRGARFRFGQTAFDLQSVKVTTGASLYLVSACQTAEEFVAAFRRYADRSGLFVPIAEPFPQGGRGRVAIALTDGRIVLEGEAEVAQSSTRPSALYGRVGMTLRFVEPDPATKTTLTELERARLAMKPAPLTAIPRSSDVPATPRPSPPPIGGRIDASNALAECVAIGDPIGFRDAAPRVTNDSPSSKFVIPTIPQLAGARPKTASVPPALQPSARKLSGTTPPPLPGSGPVALPAKVPPPKIDQRTRMGMPAVGRIPAAQLEPAPPPPVVSAKQTKQGVEPPIVEAAASIPRRDPGSLPRPPSVAPEPVVIPKKETSVGRQTTLGMPLVRLPGDDPSGSRPAAPVSTGAASAPRRANTPSTPPMPRHATPYTPLPIVRKPAPELAAQLEELTERNQIPEPPLVGEEQRKNSLGVAMLHATRSEGEQDAEIETAGSTRATVQQAPLEVANDANEATDIGAVPVAPAGRSGSLRASEIMSAMKGEDWTMAPDASQPTVLPRSGASAQAAEEKSGPHEDFVIRLDPQAPGGWSAPAKVEKLPEPKQSPASGNRNIAVASAKPIDAVEWEDKPTGIGEALVQIDPTLMEPARRIRTGSDDDAPISIVSSPMIDVEPPVRPARPLAHAAEPTVARVFAIPPSAMPRPTATAPMASGTQVQPQLPSGSATRYDPTEIARFGMGPNDAVVAAAKPKRNLVPIVVVAAGAVVAVLITVIVIMMTGGKKLEPVGGSTASPATGSAIIGSAAVVMPLEGSDQVSAPPPAVDAAVAVVETPPAKTTCNVDITTVPAGADIMLDNVTVLGTAPATIPMPCGVAQKISVRKAKYGSATRTFTASVTETKLTIRIAAPMLQIKVTSVPAGATITVGGKVIGITPTTVRVLGGGATSITLSKDGFAPDTQKIAPRQNNATHHVVLKRAIKKH